MKIRFFALLTLIVAMFIGGLVTAHAQGTVAKPVMCIGSEQHQVYTGTEVNEINGGNSIYSCINMAKTDPNVSACNLDSPTFKKCMEANAPNLVKRDPGQPAAYQLFRLYVTVNGNETYVDILAPKNGRVSGSFNGVPFNLQTAVEADGMTSVSYTIDGVEGMMGSRVAVTSTAMVGSRAMIRWYCNG